MQSRQKTRNLALVRHYHPDQTAMLRALECLLNAPGTSGAEHERERSAVPEHPPDLLRQTQPSMQREDTDDQ